MEVGGAARREERALSRALLRTIKPQRRRAGEDAYGEGAQQLHDATKTGEVAFWWRVIKNGSRFRVLFLQTGIRRSVARDACSAL